MKFIRKIFIFLIMTISSFAMDEKYKEDNSLEDNNYKLGKVFEIISQLDDYKLRKDVMLIILAYVNVSKEFGAQIKTIQSQPFDELYNLDKELTSKNFSLDKLHELEKNYSNEVKVLVCAFNIDRLDFYFKNGILSCALDSNINSKLLKDSKGAVNVVSCSPDGKYIFSGLANNTLKLYDLKDNSSRSIGFGVYHNDINAIEFTQDSKRFLTSCQNKICIWDSTRHPTDIITAVYDAPGRNYLSWDNCNIQFIKIVTNTIILVATNKGIYFVEHEWGRWRSQEILSNPSCKNIDISLKRKFFVSAEENYAKIYESNLLTAAAPKMLKDIEAKNSCNVVIISPCANFLFIACSDGMAKFFDLTNLKNIQEMSQLQAHDHSINSAKFNNDGNYLVTGSRDCTVKLWDVKDPKLPVLAKTFNADDNAIFSVDFSPDNKYIAAGTWENGTRLWDIGSANILADMNFSQLGFIIKFFNNFSKEDMTSPIFNSLNDKVKRYLYRILELRKILPDSSVKHVLEYLNRDLLHDYQVNNQQKQSSSCVIS